MLEVERQFDASLRRHALIACVQAAHAWTQRGIPEATTLDQLMTALETLARLYGQRPPVANLPALLKAFHEDFAAIHPDGDTQPLLSANETSVALTEYGRMLLATLEESPERLALEEVIQAVLQRARERHATDQGEAARDYVRFRRYVIENPVAQHSDLIGVLYPLGCRPNQLYEPIRSDRVISVGASQFVYPCHSCHWPMPYRLDRMACSALACVSDGAVFHLSEGGALTPLSTHAAPTPLPVTDFHMMVKEATWQFIVRPGQSELALFNTLGRLEGIHQTLWPDVDRADLFIERGNREWWVDVKDQAYPHLLALDLAQRTPKREVVIALPDARASQIKILKTAVKNPLYTFMTFTSLFREVAATPATLPSQEDA